MFTFRTHYILVTCISLSFALPVRREVPQEHSHEPFLTSVRKSLALANPDGIVDPVFGLLGNAAAANGAGNIADPNCLQQAIADQAFTNAKAIGDTQSQVDALIFRALERNSGSVGLATEPCTSIKAVNPEIAAIQQHQDPASPNAAAINKAITLELARQIASVGGNPQDALKAGTFAPGDVNDPTAKGNSCNDANDPNGCIFTQNLLVPDATPEEIDAAIAGIAVASSSLGGKTRPSEATAVSAPPPTASVPQGHVARTATGTNLQTFTGALGGLSAPAVTAGGKGFVVEGSDFLNIGAALGRSCDIQHNLCANAANASRSAGFSVGQCDQQNNDCHATASTA